MKFECVCCLCVIITFHVEVTQLIKISDIHLLSSYVMVKVLDIKQKKIINKSSNGIPDWRFNFTL